jgi:hypothetical protein
LVLAEGRGAPVPIHMSLKYKKESFAAPDLNFFVCVECGKTTQYDNTTNNDDE